MRQIRNCPIILKIKSSFFSWIAIDGSLHSLVTVSTPGVYICKVVILKTSYSPEIDFELTRYTVGPLVEPRHARGQERGFPGKYRGTRYIGAPGKILLCVFK
eukprot:sb/3478426/